MVRSHRGRQHQTVCRKRICPRDCSAARIGEISRPLRPRGYRSLRHHRVDHPPALVRRKRRDGGHLRLRGRAMARRRTGPSGAQGDLPLGRLQRLRRLVRFPRFLPRRRLAHVSYLLDVFSTVHEARGVPEPLLPEQEELWKAAMANPDFKMYQNLFNILTQKGQRTFIMFLSMIAPWETEDAIETAEARFRKIKIPFYTGSGAYAYTYKLHWLGAQNYFRNIDAPKKLLFAGPAHLERPFHQLHDEIIRCYAHELKGMDSGVMHEEPVRYWLMGATEWRTAADWPLPDTKWVKFYLCDWGRLSEDEPVAAELAGAAAREPDVFTQMPLKKTTKVE